MINITDKAKCSGCHACMSICPKKCITMVADNEGFLYPSVDTSKCVNCGLCEKACPIITPKENTKEENDIIAYGAYTKNEEIRLKSSSGGIFTEIATYIVNNGGVVFGAVFNDDFSVFHKSVDTIENLEPFRGSKYVQSTIGNTYKEAKELLENGRLVLFTGTPCQIGGLYSYLGKEYDNLITQDIVCHGVPSPMVWKKYKEYQEEKADSKIKSVSFRNKDSGWKTYSVVYGFENDKEYRQRSGYDLYMKSFIANLCLRPSCYECAFKKMVRQSDITLADFWGIEKVMPKMDNDKGTSLVMLNSQKGRLAFEEINNKIIYHEANIVEALKYNSSATKSSAKYMNRENFIELIDKKGFNSNINGFFKVTFINRIKKKIKNLIKN